MKTQYVYGIVTTSGEHIDVSNSGRGAKQYATLNGYDTVSRRNVNHYYVDVIAKKIGKKWVS